MRSAKSMAFTPALTVSRLKAASLLRISFCSVILILFSSALHTGWRHLNYIHSPRRWYLLWRCLNMLPVVHGMPLFHSLLHHFYQRLIDRFCRIFPFKKSGCYWLNVSIVWLKIILTLSIDFYCQISQISRATSDAFEWILIILLRAKTISDKLST